MKKIRIDLNTFEDKRELHLFLKKECEFPEFYGCNLDALHDCLSENNQFEFEIIESEKFETYLISMMRVFRDAKCNFEVIEKGE